MQQALHRSSLVPRGFVVESACYESEKALITVRASRRVGLCPSCGTGSRRIHSRYRRRVTDLPLSGRVVELLVIARRFRCEAVTCGRQIFTERFADGILAPSARRTARLDSIVHHLGLALGGRPAAGFAKRLMLPVSKDTLLRVVRRRSRSPTRCRQSGSGSGAGDGVRSGSSSAMPHTVGTAAVRPHPVPPRAERGAGGRVRARPADRIRRRTARACAPAHGWARRRSSCRWGG